jgi:undecaprenyl-diphosphatase
MHWLQSLDVSLFRFVNQTLSNPLLDRLMPFLSGNGYFVPAIFLVAVLLVWKGGVRGVICLLMLAIIVWPGDSLICNTIKHSVARNRPFVVLEGVHKLVSAGKDNSMPSSHAANWFAATMIFFIYYRRSLWILLPLACAVSFSRIYNGVHYPSDILAGAILGAGYAAAGVWLLNELWRWAGQRWFPEQWRRLPSLLAPELKSKS